VQVEPLGRVREETHPWISEGLDNLDAPVGRGLIGNHNLDVPARLTEHRGHACLIMALTVEDGDDHGDQWFAAQSDFDRRLSGIRGTHTRRPAACVDPGIAHVSTISVASKFQTAAE
jgi:hypothetical protein